MTSELPVIRPEGQSFDSNRHVSEQMKQPSGWRMEPRAVEIGDGGFSRPVPREITLRL